MEAGNYLLFPIVINRMDLAVEGQVPIQDLPNVFAITSYVVVQFSGGWW